MASAHVYEVRCPSCDVSFPPQTKRCIHCGSKLGAARARPVRPTELLAEAPPPLEDPDEQPRRSFARIGMTGIWLVLAILFSIQRACNGG